MSDRQADRRRLRRLNSQSLHRRRPGGQLSVSAALEGARAAAADGRTAQRAAGARSEDGGQPEQEPDRPASHERVTPGHNTG